MTAKLAELDPEVYAAIAAEEQRQNETIELIASENYTSPAVREAVGSVLTNKYAEGLPGRRYYGGCEFVDVVETLAIERAKALFGAAHANVQPHSGAQANMAAYFATMQPGDTLLGLDLSQGGHLTHGSPVNFSGRIFRAVHYGVQRTDARIDFDDVRRQAQTHQPRVIMVGASAYPRAIDFARFRAIADEVGAVLMADVAHIAGLIVAGLHPNPIPSCPIVTTTTHKTLRGPRGGLILCTEELAKDIDKAVFPNVQGGPLMHVIAGKAVAFKEAQAPGFQAYQGQVVLNAATLAESLLALGYSLVSGGTDNHLMLVDFSGTEMTGRKAETALDRAHITANKNMVPFDSRKPMVTSGLRIGTPTVTTRGMKEGEMRQLAGLIHRVLQIPTPRRPSNRCAAKWSKCAGSSRSTIEPIPSESGLRGSGRAPCAGPPRQRRHWRTGADAPRGAFWLEERGTPSTPVCSGGRRLMILDGIFRVGPEQVRSASAVTHRGEDLRDGGPCRVHILVGDPTAGRLWSLAQRARRLARGAQGLSSWLGHGRVLHRSLYVAESAFGERLNPDPLARSPLRKAAADLLRGLSELHARALGHGAISPECVYTDGTEYRLGGLYLELCSRGTEAAERMSAPERRLDLPCGPAADVYALGATLLWLGTGAEPGERAGQDLDALLGLGDLLLRDPDRRPSAREALDRLSRGGLRERRPPSDEAQVREQARRLEKRPLPILLKGEPDSGARFLLAAIACELRDRRPLYVEAEAFGFAPYGVARELLRRLDPGGLSEAGDDPVALRGNLEDALARSDGPATVLLDRGARSRGRSEPPGSSGALRARGPLRLGRVRRRGADHGRRRGAGRTNLALALAPRPGLGWPARSGCRSGESDCDGTGREQPRIAGSRGGGQRLVAIGGACGRRGGREPSRSGARGR